MANAAFLAPIDAARRLGVSSKALRLYEDRGLLSPGRTPAGWRAYSVDDMARAREIVALRELGLSLAQIKRMLDGEASDVEPQLAAHQATLEARLGDTSAAIGRLREMRARIASGERPAVSELAMLCANNRNIPPFDLPWPWGGEMFDLGGARSLTWIVGPLFSGKTRLAMRIAEAIPGAAFIGLPRPEIPADKARVERALRWLVEDGATPTEALAFVVRALEAEAPQALVFDLIEQGLDEATQVALAAWLRKRRDRRLVFAMTRSSAMLDLCAVGADEAFLLCPANHSAPMFVAPYPGAQGYETLASCLGSPDIRARSEGVVAMRQGAT